MTTFEKLIAARIAVAILTVAVLTTAIILYENYASEIFSEVEQVLAVSMGSFDSGIAAR